MSHYFKKNIKNVIIIFRDSQIESVCKEVQDWLNQKKIQTKFFCQSSIDGKTCKEKADLVVVLGGDGTYLGAIRFISDKSIPMIGINMGSLGFLTVHVKEKIFECLDQVLTGKMVAYERCLIQVQEEKADSSFLALNDVVIERGLASQLIHMTVFLDDLNIYSLKADGLIVSSATGSTAYNLAAGGPILLPTVKAFVVTPICPHSLTHRPVIFPDDRVLKFQVQAPHQGARVTIDGRKQLDLSQNSCVVIKKSNQVHHTLKNPHQCDFIYLKDKLKFFD